MFKTIIKYIIHLNFVIATSAGLLIAGICNVFLIENDLYYGFFGFFSTLFVYNSQRLFKANIETKTAWLKWVYQHRKIIFFLSISSGIISGYLFFKLLNKVTPIIVLLFILAIMISLFYVIKIKGRSLRELPYVKIHSIALTWTLVIVLFPILNENIYDLDILLIFIPANYIYFVAVAIPFDIRDLKHDSLTQRTIPQVVGIRNSKLISILLLISTALGIGIVFPNILKTLTFVIALSTQITLIVLTTVNRQEIYYSLLIDGAIALLGISYLTINN